MTIQAELSLWTENRNLVAGKKTVSIRHVVCNRTWRGTFSDEELESVEYITSQILFKGAHERDCMFTRWREVKF